MRLRIGEGAFFPIFSLKLFPTRPYIHTRTLRVRSQCAVITRVPQIGLGVGRIRFRTKIGGYSIPATLRYSIIPVFGCATIGRYVMRNLKFTNNWIRIRFDNRAFVSASTGRNDFQLCGGRFWRLNSYSFLKFRRVSDSTKFSGCFAD